MHRLPLRPRLRRTRRAAAQWPAAGSPVHEPLLKRRRDPRGSAPLP